MLARDAPAEGEDEPAAPAQQVPWKTGPLRWDAEDGEERATFKKVTLTEEERAQQQAQQKALRKANKKAVKEEQRERRKEKVPKQDRKRHKKLAQQKRKKH